MLYDISNNFFVDITEITHIRCEQNDISASEYPYRMIVRMKDGHECVTRYRTKEACQRDVRNIVSDQNRTKNMPVTRYEVEAIVRAKAEKLKRFIHKQLTITEKEAISDDTT